MKRRVIFPLTLLVACGTAQASEWVSLGKNDSGKAEVFVDVTTIKVTGPIRLVWVKAAAAHHTEKGVGTTRGKGEPTNLPRFLSTATAATPLSAGGLINLKTVPKLIPPPPDSPPPWKPSHP